MNLRDALRDQARACASLGSPFTARLLALAADRLTAGAAVADRMLAWPGDTTSRGASVPLRLAGGQHALVQTGQDAGLATRHPGHLHLIFHTIAWQYFPASVQARCDALLLAAGAQATGTTPLAHLGMEADASPDGSVLTLRLWPHGETVPLGRADFHGRWIAWQAPPA